MMTCVLKFGPQGRGRMNWILPLHATLNFFGFSTARRQFLCHLAGRRSTGGRFGGAARSGRNLYHHGSLPGARRQICDLGHFSVPLLKGTSSILATFRISRHICYHRRMNRRSCHDSIEFIIDIYIYIFEKHI